MEPAKRRILFLLTTSDWGGVQFFVLQLANEAQRRGHTVMVAAGGHMELEARCRESHIPYAHLEMMRRDISPFHDLAALTEIRKLLREYRPDIVHLNSSKMGVLGSLAAQLEHVPRTIYRIGGWSFLEEQPAWKKKIYEIAERWSAPKKDVIVTVHPNDEKVAVQLGIKPRHRLVTIPNGIDLTTFDRQLLSRENARRELGLPLDKFVIGTVANYYPPKNLPWYITNVVSASSDEKNLFVMVGDGPEKKQIESAREKLPNAEILKLVGRRSDATRLLNAFDLFVLPSSKEGMPWVLLEAMAAGLPCIATDVGACRWMLEAEAGIIVPANNATALISAIQKLASSQSGRERLGTNARHAVETRFRWEDTLRQSMDLFI